MNVLLVFAATFLVSFVGIVAVHRRRARQLGYRGGDGGWNAYPYTAGAATSLSAVSACLPGALLGVLALAYDETLVVDHKRLFLVSFVAAVVSVAAGLLWVSRRPSDTPEGSYTSRTLALLILIAAYPVSFLIVRQANYLLDSAPPRFTQTVIVDKHRRESPGRVRGHYEYNFLLEEQDKSQRWYEVTEGMFSRWPAGTTVSVAHARGLFRIEWNELRIGN